MSLPEGLCLPGSACGARHHCHKSFACKVTKKNPFSFIYVLFFLNALLLRMGSSGLWGVCLVLRGAEYSTWAGFQAGMWTPDHHFRRIPCAVLAVIRCFGKLCAWCIAEGFPLHLLGSPFAVAEEGCLLRYGTAPSLPPASSANSDGPRLPALLWFTISKMGIKQLSALQA